MCIKLANNTIINKEYGIHESHLQRQNVVQHEMVVLFVK